MASCCSTSRRHELQRRPAGCPPPVPCREGGTTGSLDPLATGLLPLCFGEATKIAGLLLGRPRPTTPRSARPDHRYLPKARCCASAPCRPSVPKRCRPLAALTGNIRQRAPIYSALKQGGEPLYAKAAAARMSSKRRTRGAGACHRGAGQQPERLRLRVTRHLYPQPGPRSRRGAGLRRAHQRTAAAVGRAVP
jgi:hypothetical protein